MPYPIEKPKEGYMSQTLPLSIGREKKAPKPKHDSLV